eukprot:4126046-Lingulodinium_polyedra.AAC.1
MVVIVRGHVKLLHGNLGMLEGKGLVIGTHSDDFPWQCAPTHELQSQRVLAKVNPRRPVRDDAGLVIRGQPADHHHKRGPHMMPQRLHPAADEVRGKEDRSSPTYGAWLLAAGLLEKLFPVRVIVCRSAPERQPRQRVAWALLQFVLKTRYEGVRKHQEHMPVAPPPLALHRL